MDDELESPRSSSPLEGYDTAGEEAHASSGGDTTIPSPSRRKKTPKRPLKRPQRLPVVRHAQRDSKGRFIKVLACCSKPRRETVTGSENGGNGDDESVDSLQWDAHTEELDTTQVERQWTAETHHGDLSDESDESGPSTEEQDDGGRVSVLGQQYRMTEVDRTRDMVERTLLEIEDDILPFQGKNLTNGRLNALAAKAATLKRALQDGHLYLTANDADEYQANLAAKVTANRRSLSAFIVELEEVMALREVAATQAANVAAHTDEARLNARQVVVRTRVAVLQNQVKSLLQDGRVFCTTKASTDEELYERAEKHKLLGGRLLTALEECKLLANQALEHDLIEESTNLDGATSSLRALQSESEDSMLNSRKVAGVWSEKGRRSAARGDMKMPVFSGATGEKLTIYEFEKDWAAYRAAVNYSVEEALKELKMAV